MREAFNLGTGLPFSSLEVVREVLRVMGCEDLEPELQETVSGGGDRMVNSERARHELQWTPRRSLREGLVETVSWYTRTLEA